MRKLVVGLAAAGLLALGCNGQDGRSANTGGPSGEPASGQAGQGVSGAQTAPSTPQRPADWSGYGQNPNYEAGGNPEGAGGGAYNAHETLGGTPGAGESGAMMGDAGMMAEDGGMMMEGADGGAAMHHGKKHKKGKSRRGGATPR